MNNVGFEGKASINQARYRKKLAKVRLGSGVDRDLSIADQKIFTELESLISEQKETALTSGCRCSICLQVKEEEKESEDYFGRTPDAEKKMFLLLQQLTMIEPDIAIKVLGEIRIPTIFFRRNRRREPLRGGRKAPLVRNVSNTLSLQPKHRGNNFIMFQSNAKTGLLEEPEMVGSIAKVISSLKTKEEDLRKVKEEKRLSEIEDFNRNYENEKVIADGNMNERIPPFFLSSTCKKSLLENKHNAVTYIMHGSSSHSKKKQQENKIKQTEPFCLFRYEADKDSEVNSKYEIFTLNRLEIYMMKNQESTKSNPPVTCIESYTRTKINPIFPKDIVEGIFSVLGIKTANTPMPVPVSYFVEYNQSSPKTDECAIFSLTKLEVMLKTQQISKLSPEYIDQFELEHRIDQMIGREPPTTERGFQILATYKTYKIVNVLRLICNIALMEIKLKWLLSEDDGLVLTECSEYLIDVPRSLLKKKNKIERNATIITNGLSMLDERVSFDDLNDSPMQPQDRLKEDLKVIMANRKPKPLAQSRRHPEGSSIVKLKKEISKSMVLTKEDKFESMVIFSEEKIISSDKSTRVETFKNSRSQNSSGSLFGERFPSLHNCMFGSSPYKEKYRLKPFNMDLSRRLKSENLRNQQAGF